MWGRCLTASGTAVKTVSHRYCDRPLVDRSSSRKKVAISHVMTSSDASDR